MTHVLDWPIEFVAMVVAKAGGHGKLKMVEEWGAVLRILRAERDGTREEVARKQTILGEALARELAIAVNMFSSAGSPYGRRAFQVIDRYRKAHANDESDKASEAIDEMRDSLRAEGRREEREAVVRSMRDAIQRYGSTMAMDGPGAVMQLADAIERGDHWRGGEG